MTLTEDLTTLWSLFGLRVRTERWACRPRIAVELAGVEPCLPLFGAG